MSPLAALVVLKGYAEVKEAQSGIDMPVLIVMWA